MGKAFLILMCLGGVAMLAVGTMVGLVQLFFHLLAL